ncbi:MAG: VOC family protein [Acidobacteriota bacterium]
MTPRANRSEIGGVSPFFIVKDVAAAFAFYCDKLGFEVTFQAEPDDLLFGIVQRGRSMIFLKYIGVEPVPNHTREIGKGTAPWDAYIYVPNPDALAAEFASSSVQFSKPLEDTHEGLRGFELTDP